MHSSSYVRFSLMKGNQLAYLLAIDKHLLAIDTLYNSQYQYPGFTSSFLRVKKGSTFPTAAKW